MVHLGTERIAAGDKIIVSGSIGDHGIAVLVAREAFTLGGGVTSDCAPLHELTSRILATAGENVKVLRDPMRGGIAATLNEFALSAHKGVQIDETLVPVRPEVRSACELLGFDPMHIANEGKLVAVVVAECAERILNETKRLPLVWERLWRGLSWGVGVLSICHWANCCRGFVSVRRGACPVTNPALNHRHYFGNLSLHCGSKPLMQRLYIGRFHCDDVDSLRHNHTQLATHLNRRRKIDMMAADQIPGGSKTMGQKLMNCAGWSRTGHDGINYQHFATVGQ